MPVSINDSAQPVPSLPLRAVLPPKAAPEVSPPQHAQRGSPSFAEVLQHLAREIGRGEAVSRSAMASIRSAVDLEPSRLLSLQEGVYRYSEAIELASRLVDRAAGSVKTVLQGAGQ